MNNLTLYRLRLIQRYIRDYGNKDALMAQTAMFEIVSDMIKEVEEQILEDIRRNGT